jgi:hypothetical protein
MKLAMVRQAADLTPAGPRERTRRFPGRDPKQGNVATRVFPRCAASCWRGADMEGTARSPAGHHAGLTFDELEEPCHASD